MSRWLPAVATGILLSMIALTAAFALRPGLGLTASERADALAGELRCPDCQGLSVADSPTASAQEIRRQIDELIAAGASDQSVRDHYVARFGEWILLAPRSPLLWAVPFAVVLAAAAGLGWVLARRRQASPGPGGGELSADQRTRLREEVEALDA